MCCRSHRLVWKLVFASLLLQHTLAFDVNDYNKRQGLIPLARVGRNYLPSVLDEKPGEITSVNRLGLWEPNQLIMPYPRIGRGVVNSDILEYGVLSPEAEYDPSFLNNPLFDPTLSDQLLVQKKSRMRLIPRIGRKKRSLIEDHEEEDDKSSKEVYQKMSKADTERSWEDVEDKRAIFIPRIGRASLMSSIAGRGARLKYRSRGAFIPRIGRRTQ